MNEDLTSPLGIGIKEEENGSTERLSTSWRVALTLVVVAGFTVLILLSASAYRDAPPIPRRVMRPSSETVFSDQDILQGQQV